MAKRRPRQRKGRQSERAGISGEDLQPVDVAARLAEKVAKRIERRATEPGVNERLLGVGRELLSDEIPGRLEMKTASEVARPLGLRGDDVRVHTGPRAAQAADAMGARAFAIGDRDIFFAGGEYDPKSPRGTALLAHELAHVASPRPGIGFSRSVPARDEEERHATEVEEMVLAREEEAAAGAELEARSEQAEDEGTGDGQGGQDDAEAMDPAKRKEIIEEKVWKILERASARERERFGI